MHDAMRKAILTFLLLALTPIVWVHSTAPCNIHKTRIYDWYIIQFGLVDPGFIDLPLTQTSIDFEPWKPYTGCAIAWKLVAIDASGNVLPEQCSPTIISIDGAPMWSETP